MVILGSDFMYKNAYTWYTNLDKLIKYINLRVCGTPLSSLVTRFL